MPCFWCLGEGSPKLPLKYFRDPMGDHLLLERCLDLPSEGRRMLKKAATGGSGGMRSVHGFWSGSRDSS